MPVMRTIKKAMRLSSFCLTTATAIISEPMMNRTESLIRLRATSVDSSPSSSTWPTTIKSATAGSGIGSVTNRMVATTDMARTIRPASVSPSGNGRPAPDSR